jgi:glycogen debranching enzyme
VTRDGRRYAFTCPAPPRYHHQWHWDSCFHAIAWRLIDPARARAELRTVLRTGRADGFLPHTAFWQRSAGWRRAPLYATHRVRGNAATASIGPPVLPLAWELVAGASGDEQEAFVAEGLAPLAAHLDWLVRERDPDGDGLLTILLPDESGMDDAPKYDAVYGRLCHWKPGYALLVQRCRRLGWDAEAYCARYSEHVEDVLVNTLYALSLHAMARMSGEARFAERAHRVERALVRRSLDPDTGLFYDLAGRDEEPVRVSTWSALAPLALPGVGEDVRRRLVEEHLLEPRRYRAPVGIPSVAMDEPAFKPGFDLWRCWRGPSWVNTAWLIVPALRELGYEADAQRIVASLCGAARDHGLREYYDPRTGRGLASRNFGWSTLLLDLAV